MEFTYTDALEIMFWAWKSAVNTLPILIAAGLAYLTIKCVYRIFFHPLAKFPGPFLAKTSDLYAAYHAWRGDIHEDILRCHERYGEHVRYGPGRLLFNTAQGVNDIYSHRSTTLKSKVYHTLSQQAPSLLTMRDKATHGRRRRVVSQAFSDSTLRSFEPQILDKIQQLVDTLTPEKSIVGSKTPQVAPEWSAPKDMARYFDYLAFDIMTDVIFSAKYNTIGDEKFRYAIRTIEKSNVRLGVLVQAPILSKLGRVFQRTLFPEAIKSRDRFVKFIKKLLGVRLTAKDAEKKDIFSFIQKATDPSTGKGLDKMELSAETATMIVAGSDTTSTAMAATLHYITHSSECSSKVNEEVRSRFSSLGEVRLGPTLNSCAYLRSCIDEALRMSPPGGGPLWREVGEGGAIIDGVQIPEGYDVAVGIHSIHHNPVYFPNPYEFEPMRWMKSDGVECETPQMYKAYIPFGMGARSCVGKPMALHELMLATATLIYQFEMRAIDRDEDLWSKGQTVPKPFLLRDHVTGQKDGPLIEFQLRKTHA